jgi:hypothetical protein
VSLEHRSQVATNTKGEGDLHRIGALRGERRACELGMTSKHDSLILMTEITGIVWGNKKKMR